MRDREQLLDELALIYARAAFDAWVAAQEQHENKQPCNPHIDSEKCTPKHASKSGGTATS